MKNLLIIYNVIFLLVGNSLFSTIHYSSEHGHNHGHNHNHHHDYKDNECQECITFENSNNYFSDYHELNFSNNNISQLVFQYLSIFEFNINKRCNSRAPPTFL